jgi:hypothetical protein
MERRALICISCPHRIYKSQFGQSDVIGEKKAEIGAALCRQRPTVEHRNAIADPISQNERGELCTTRHIPDCATDSKVHWSDPFFWRHDGLGQ